jgi:TctA family transporter
MTLVLSILAGIATGLVCSSIPGIRLALAIALLLTTNPQEEMGSVVAAAFVAAAIGATVYTERLTMLLNPLGFNAQNIASMDPALRLVAQGKGEAALRIMLQAIDNSLVPIGAFVALVAIGAALSSKFTSYVAAMMGSLALPMLLLWLVMTVKRSCNPVAALGGLLLTGLAGWLTFHNRLVAGHELSMVPLLTGLFAIPLAVVGWASKEKPNLFQNGEGEAEDIQYPTSWMGSGLGMVSGFLPGLGASSVVSLVESRMDSDEQYLAVSTSCETTNDLVGVFLVLAVGLARSGEAVQMSRLVTQPDLATISILLISTGLGVAASRHLVFSKGRAIGRIIHSLPTRAVIIAALALNLIQVGLAGGATVMGQMIVWGIVLLACLASAYSRALGLPNQVAFGALVVPLLVSMVLR